MPLPSRNHELAIPLQALVIKMINGYSPLLCIVGDETGVGKSRIALRVAELIYWYAFNKIWKPKDNVFFSMTAFKDSLFNSEGRIFILEEAEIELGSDSWASMENRWFSRIKDTQRIKGNLYIVVLPLLMALARKHRRRINFIFDVKNRGYANCYKLKKHSANLLGDELGKFYIGSVQFELPDCNIEFDFLDRENKNKIEKEQSEIFDKEIEYRKKSQEARLIKINKIINNNPNKTGNTEKAEKYVYKCHACGIEFESKHEIGRVIKCDNCGQRVYIDIQNLVSSPNSLKNNGDDN